MRCPYCGTTLTENNSCPGCGRDIVKFKRLYRISNRYYNEALEMAKGRDLTGAIAKLKDCLKIDKRNTDARNLLGLIYNEMGESVEALSEWVISKNYKEKNNIADKYISMIQDDPSRLSRINQSVKKFNSALSAARNGNPDIAVISLKKVVAENGHFLKALQLLSLLYIHNKDYVRARKYLEMALKIDISNPVTNRYLDEVGRHTEEVNEAAVKAVKVEDRYVSGRESFAPKSTYREYHPNFMPWITLIIGIALGIGIFMVLIVPGIRQQATSNNRNEIVSVNEELAKANSELDASKTEVESLTKQLSELKKQIGEPVTGSAVSSSAVASASAVNDYNYLFKAISYYLVPDNEKAASVLIRVDKNALTNKDALSLYNKVADAVFEEQSNELFNQGRDTYNAGNYDEAIKLLRKSLKMNPDNVDSIYFLGRAYDRKGDAKKAAAYYNKIINDYSETSRAPEARSRLRALGISVE